MSTLQKVGRSYGHGVTLEYRRGRQHHQSGEAGKWHVLVNGRSVFDSVYYDRADARAEREAASRRE